MANGYLGSRGDLCRSQTGIRKMFVDESLNPWPKLLAVSRLRVCAANTGRQNAEIGIQCRCGFFPLQSLGLFIQRLREPGKICAGSCETADPLGDRDPAHPQA